MSSSPETRARSSQYERGWALLYRLIRLNGSLSGNERNVLYWNRGDGTFADLSGVAGLDFPEDGRSFVAFDFDRDGDLDILLNNRNSPQLRLLRNDLPTAHAAVAFRLEGTESNRDGVGARLVLETASGRRLTRSVRSGSGFRSQPSRTVHFGLGGDEAIREVAVHWPSGAVDRHAGVPAGHFVSLREGAAEFAAVPFGKPTASAPAPGLADPEPRTDRSGIWLTEATPAPRLRGRTLEGERLAESPFGGQRLVLNFWATWCAPCQAELADFVRERASLERASLLPVLVSVDDPSEVETVRRYARERQLPFPVVLPDQDTVTAFDLLVRHILDQSAELAIPTTLLVDEEGRIAKLYLGRTTAERILADAANWPRGATEFLERGLPFAGRAYVTRFERNWVQLADAYAAAGLGDEAVATLEHAAEAHPGHAAILDRLGGLYAEQGRWREALAKHREAVALGLPGIAAQLNVATALAELDRLVEARAVASEALDSAPRDPDALRVWGAVASRQGDFDDALPVLSSAREIDPDNAEVHYNLGWLHLQVGRAAEAESALRAALELNPSHAKALHDLGILHARSGAWESATQAFRRAVLAHPDFPEAHYSLGLVHAQQGDFGRAEASLRKAVEIRPQYAEALTDLGSVYIQTGRHRQALPLLERARRAKPDLGQAYVNAARAHLALGDTDSAVAVAKDLLRVRPDDPNAWALLERLGAR